MYACPNCSLPVFSWWQKFTATEFKPVSCPSCRSLSSKCVGFSTSIFSLLIFSDYIFYVIIALGILVNEFFLLLIPAYLFILVFVLLCSLYSPFLQLKVMTISDLAKAKTMLSKRRRVSLYGFLSGFVLFIGYIIFSSLSKS